VRCYNAFEIGPEGGAYLRTYELDCPNDEAAKVSASALPFEHKIELWFSKRFIAQFERQPPQTRAL
jgi:hypothetical protein